MEVATQMTVETTVQPTVVDNPFPDGQVRVALFGQPLDWRQPSLERWRRIAAWIEMKRLPISTVLTPSPTRFNAEVCQPAELADQAVVSDHLTLQVGHYADGVMIPECHAMWLSTGDCPTIVAYQAGTKELVAAHAGRDCLLEPEAVQTGTRSGNRNFSVVDSILGSIQGSPEGIAAKIYLGIAGQHFIHSPHDETYGKKNRRLLKFLNQHYGEEVIARQETPVGALDLRKLIIAQFRRGRVCSVTHDDHDTYGDRLKNGQPAWASHARWTKNGKQGPDSRNGLLIMRLPRKR